MFRMFGAAVAAAVTVGVMTVPAPPAEAATVKYFRMATELGGETAGQAKARGEIVFRSAKRVIVRGWIADVCPGDGAGAYLRTRIVLDKDSNNVIERGIAYDTNNCGNGRIRFWVRLPNDGYPITRIELILSSRVGGPGCTSDSDPCKYRLADNPYA